MSDAVLADAQFGTAKVIRPFDGFESVYEGVSGSRSIALPGDLASDAGEPGINEKLISGFSVPFGSKLVIWLPTLFRTSGAGISPQKYQYSFLWRLRNIRDFRANRAAYHFPKQSLGENDEFVIPASKKVILYENASEEANSGSVKNQTQVSFESIDVSAILIPDNAPLTKDGDVATLQQGLGDVAGNNTATFNSVQLDAEGDELLILVSKKTNDPWDFVIEDKPFSDFFGRGSGKAIQDLGVYIFSGSNP